MKNKMLLIQPPGYGIQPSMGVYALQMEGVEILDMNLDSVLDVFGPAYSLSLTEESMREQIALQQGYWNKFEEFQEYDAIHEWLSRYKAEFREYNLFGVSVYGIWQFVVAGHIARYLKETVPGSKIVVGGPVVDDYYPEIAPKLINLGFDSVVAGDGAEQIKTLVTDGSFEKCYSSSFARDGQILTTSNKKVFPRPPVFHQNLLEYPAPQAAAAPMNVGCYYGMCSFCAEGSYLGNYVKVSNESLISNMVKLKEQGVPIVIGSGSGIRKEELRALLKDCNAQGEKLPRFGMESRCFPIDEELAGLIKESKCFRLNFGLESPDPKICNDVFNKGVNLNRFKEGLEILGSVGYHEVKMNILIHPFFHKKDDIKRIAEFLNKYDCIREYILYPLQIPQGKTIERFIVDTLSEPMCKPFGNYKYYCPEGFEEWYFETLHYLADNVQKPYSLLDEMMNDQIAFLALEQNDREFIHTQHKVIRDLIDSWSISYFNWWVEPNF